MVRPSRPSALRLYYAVVSMAGLALFGALAAGGGIAALRHAPLAFWLFAMCLLVSELIPIVVPGSQGPVEGFVMSDAFAFALLLGWGVAAAVLVGVAVSLAADRVHRRPLAALAFNAGQYGIALAAAGGLYTLVAGDRPFHPGQFPAFVAAALVFIALNEAFVRVALALDEHAPPHPRSLSPERLSGTRGSRRFRLLIPHADAARRRYLTVITGVLLEGVRAQALPAAMLFGVAPVAVLLAERGAALLPLLVLPPVAVYLASRGTVEAETRLRESERLKDDLLATVSHELRTPLASISALLNTLRQHGGRLEPAQREEFLGIAVTQSEQLRHMIEQLLLAARLRHDAGHQPAGPVAAERPLADAAALAGRAAQMARLAHPERPIELALETSLPARADEEAVLRILGNLLDNAVKYSPPKLPVRVEARREGAAAVLAVEDRGPGIRPADRERAFERFTQLGPAHPGAPQTSGLGLGLHIARQLARANGGELSLADSSGGRGARFELRLPLAEAALEREVEKVADPPASRYRR
jgi:signal transduction histidine kinase